MLTRFFYIEKCLRSEEKSKIILNYKNEKIPKFKKYKTIDKKRQKIST